MQDLTFCQELLNDFFIKKRICRHRVHFLKTVPFNNIQIPSLLPESRWSWCFSSPRVPCPLMRYPPMGQWTLLVYFGVDKSCFHAEVGPVPWALPAPSGGSPGWTIHCLPPAPPGLGSLSPHRGQLRNVCTITNNVMTGLQKVPSKVVAEVTIKGEEKPLHGKAWICTCMNWNGSFNEDLHLGLGVPALHGALFPGHWQRGV